LTGILTSRWTRNKPTTFFQWRTWITTHAFH